MATAPRPALRSPSSWSASAALDADRLRTPLFVAGIVLAAAVVAVELGLAGAVGGGRAGPGFRSAAEDVLGSASSGAQLPVDPAEAEEPSGLAIRYLALVDGFLLFVLLLQGTSLVVGQRVAAKVQGVVTLVVSLLWVLAAVLLGLAAVGTLLLMVGLLLAQPFGTLVYLAAWGFFPVGDAALVLSLLMLLKLVMAGVLVASNPRFLTVKGLVALFLASVLLQVVLAWLHGFLPGVVVSIGDALWAVIIAVVALVWAVLSLVGAVPAVLKAVRSGAGG